MDPANVTSETLNLSCDACGAALTVGKHVRATVCPYCDSPSVVERPATKGYEPPSFILGFIIGREKAVAQVGKWLKKFRLFGPSGLKSATFEKTRGVYVPAYLYGAVARTEYSANIGENYTETYTTTDSKGNMVVRTRTVTEWRKLSGRYATYLVDVVVTASKGVSNPELEAVEPFDLKLMRRYDPKIVSGWLAEEPTLSRREGARLAHDESVRLVDARLSAFMPGDKHAALEHRTEMENEVIDLTLLPLWIFSARYAADKPPVKILVNGQTGEVYGKVPCSKFKIAVAVVLGLLVIVGIYLWVAHVRGRW